MIAMFIQVTRTKNGGDLSSVEELLGMGAYVDATDPNKVWNPHAPPQLVSRSQTLYLKKQRGKGLVKLPWQIGCDHTTIFEALNWIFEVCVNHYGE